MKENASITETLTPDQLRQFVQQKEIEIFDKILEAQKKRSKLIEEAEKEAKEQYDQELERLESILKERKAQFQSRMNEIMVRLEKKEQDYLDQLAKIEKVNQKKAVDFCLKYILP